MKRRIFLKNSIITSTGYILIPAFNKPGYGTTRSVNAIDELEKNFITPPASSRPWVFWMWMNGNITKEGITVDLEAMKRMGIGGAINFNSAVGIPRGPVDYASGAWMEATAHAVREAQRLGLELTIHNSPGYSGAGGLNNSADYDISSGVSNNQITDKTKEPSGISMVFEFAEPFEARAISILRKPETPRDLFDGPRDHPPLFRLEGSDEGINFKIIGTVRAPELREMDTPAALSFAAVTAKYYRLVTTGPSWVSDVQLYNGPRLGGWPGKTNNTHGDKIKELVEAGMILAVNNKPIKAYGFSSKDEEVVKIANELYGALNGTTVKEQNYGKGKVFWGKPLREIFDQQNIKPDFEYTAQNQDATIHYIHKRIGNSEFYFVSNHKRRQENIVCSFRVAGKQPEIWNTETGKIADAALYETIDGRITLPLQLQPASSMVVLFRKAFREGYTTVIKDGKQIISTNPFTPAKNDLYADVQIDFTVALWAKPDTYAHGNKSFLFQAPQGEVVYGSGHAAFGLAAGQNAVRIYERGRGPAREVLTSNQPLEGWTHLAVVYQHSKPSLYINGKLTANNEGSGRVIHPGMGTPATEEQFSSYFEGNYTGLELYREVLSEEKINQLYLKGLPESELPSGIEISQNKDGKLKALFWQNGKYSINGIKGNKPLAEVTSCNVKNVDGSWLVKFPSGFGAPLQIEFPALMALQKYPDFNVKHFSGTATWIKLINIAKTDLQPGQKIFLDLGRVEVVAEVKVNGKNLGILWKEPFRVDITKAIVFGTNKLEIQVTNLWPNRLIGDEHLPPDNEYSEHRFIKKLPDWYVNNKPKPGKRVTFSV